MDVANNYLLVRQIAREYIESLQQQQASLLNGNKPVAIPSLLNLHSLWLYYSASQISSGMERDENGQEIFKRE
jgi:hypothetical protein